MAVHSSSIEKKWRSTVLVLANRSGFESPGWALTFSVICAVMTWTMIPMGLGSLLEVPIISNLIRSVAWGPFGLTVVKWCLLALGTFSSAICFAKSLKICFPEYYGD